MEIQILVQAVDISTGHAREQERQTNGNKISYLRLLEITARLMEHK